VGKSKTEAGTGRVIPLNETAIAALEAHAAWYTRRFGDCRPEWFVFRFGTPLPKDPTRPITSFKTAWTKVRQKAGVKGRWDDIPRAGRPPDAATERGARTVFLRYRQRLTGEHCASSDLVLAFFQGRPIPSSLSLARLNLRPLQSKSGTPTSWGPPFHCPHQVGAPCSGRTTGDLMRIFDFAKIADWDDRLEALAGVAEPERWTYLHAPSQSPLPVLSSYIQYTFLRAFDQQKIVEGDRLACFNTGLLTPGQEEIFGVFTISETYDRTQPISFGNQKWWLKLWVRSGDRLLTDFMELPRLAEYWNDRRTLFLIRNSKFN
jgi:hypothetical protein